jgi:hypothetical protein
MGPSFFKFCAELAISADKLTQMQLDDLIQRCGREAATKFLVHATDSEAESINREFIRQTPDYCKSGNNYSLLVDYLGEQYLGYGVKDGGDDDEIVTRLMCDGYWTVGHLQAAWEEVKASGQADLPEGVARPLDEDDRAALSLAAAAVSNPASLDRLLTAYVRMALNDESLTWQDCSRNAAYGEVARDAVFFAWAAKCPNYRPSQGAKEFIFDYISGRFPTFDLLNSAWKECVRETGGRGYISTLESEVEQIESSEDREINRINAKYSVG